MKRLIYTFVLMLPLFSCELLDNDIEKHTDENDSTYVSLNQVAEILSAISIGNSQMREVFDAVSSSSDNGYDEEYMMRHLFTDPGRGVGDLQSKSPKSSYGVPLKDMIRDYLEVQAMTKSDGCACPDKIIDVLTTSDIQIYWPFSERWNEKSLPIVTFDPEDGSENNIGYRLMLNDDGTRQVQEVVVDEGMAEKEPVWVVNRNSDSDYTTLEMLRREDPAWGEGGGTIIVKPSGSSSTKSSDDSSLKTILLKDFTMKEHFDSWFAGGSEFWVKAGSVEDFTASTEAELRLYTPVITDFLVVVKRDQKGIPVPFNAILISDWSEQMTDCAFMITEDDGGTLTTWECKALVRVASKSYGIEIELPFNSRDDIVWRGQLSRKWFEENSNVTGHFGNVDLTFEVLEY